MKTPGLTGSAAAPDQGDVTSRESRFSRMVLWLTRGEVPVDGFCFADENLDKNTREAGDAGLIPRAPVRWGNFR